MFEETLQKYKKVIEYSIYLLVFLNILDIVSTYIGIQYFDAYEANEKTAYLFDLFGMLLPSSLKIITVMMLSYTIKVLWRNSEYILFNSGGWRNFLAVISSLNALFIMIFLNMIYLFIVLNNINVIYNL